jgi:phage terminase large subunit GpA-like protein
VTISHRTKEQRGAAAAWLMDLVEKIPTRLSVELCSDWIEEHVIITEGAYQGRYSFKLTPYLREIADNFSIRSPCQEFAVIKANQLGFSIVSMGAILYYIKHGIGPGLFVSGDATMAEEAFEKRLDPMIEAAGLRGLIRAVVKKGGGARATGDTKGVKSYAGTFLRAVGPNSEGKLRSFPSRLNIVEEIDVFPQSLKGAGNPVEKIVRRADSFGPTRRIYYNSTPKAKATSQILPLVESGDRRMYKWKCPACGHQQPFVWGGFHWDKDEHGAPDIQIDDQGRVKKDPVWYECANPECKHQLRESIKYRLMLDAKAGGTAAWVPTQKPTRPGMRSYILPAFYSPFRSWLDIAAQFHRVKDDPILLPDFVNDVLAECWEETKIKPEPHELMARADGYEFGTIPNGVAFTTLAADIQADRIEACLMGWARNMEAWVLQYWVFDGTTADPDAPCWAKLHEIIERNYPRADGLSLGGPLVTFIDAGYNTTQVNYFCDQYTYDKTGRTIGGVFPVEGRENLQAIYKFCSNEISTPKVALHDQKLKKTVYTFLRRDSHTAGAALPYGYIHFSKSLGESFYQQLTAEEWYEEKRAGKKVSKIENRKQRRNEALDVVKMNYGAVYFTYLRFFEEVNKRRKRKQLHEVDADWAVFWNKFDRSDNGEDGEEA